MCGLGGRQLGGKGEWKMVRLFSRLVTLVWAMVALAGTATLAGCTVNQGIQPFDQDKMVLMQFQKLIEGEEIAVVDTSLGNFSMRFFPSEAPKTVEHFIQLAQQGCFDGEVIDKLVQNTRDQLGTVSLLAQADETKHQNIEIDGGFRSEISYNLGHFPGAVSAYCPDGTVDGGFFIVGDHPVSQEQLDEITGANYPQQLVEKFQEVGGYPEYWLQSSIFAQVIEGMETVDAIIDQLGRKNGEPVTIQSVVICRYGETPAQTD